MMTMDARAFVDTNVLLRALMPQLPLHKPCEALIQKMWTDSVELWINRQIIREYLVQALHPNTFSPPLTVAQVTPQISLITALFRTADETHQTTSELLRLLQMYEIRGKQVHDANLVATMKVYGIETLLTLNIGDFKRFEPAISIIVPTQNSP
jgi:predicted nucleic acid-binding protein